MNAAIAWLGVHRWRSAVVILVPVAIASGWVGTVVIDRVGVRNVNPVTVGLLAPVVASVAGALACTGPTAMMPHSTRVKVARGGWAALTTGAATLASLPAAVPTVGVGGAAPLAILRSVLIASALALAMVASGRENFLWLPPVALTLCAMQFGGRYTYAWWAASINPQVTAAGLTAAVALWVTAVMGYAIAPREGRSPLRQLRQA